MDKLEMFSVQGVYLANFAGLWVTGVERWREARERRHWQKIMRWDLDIQEEAEYQKRVQGRKQPTIEVS